MVLATTVKRKVTRLKIAGPFEAIGKGNLTIIILNGLSTTRILLRDVLYAPKMGITLVSIGKLNVAGYTALFHDK